MKVLTTRNVHDALPLGIDYLKREGQERDSRNGPVLVAPGPVTTRYERPRERVLLWADRDANPFFHLMEGLWMLAGRNDVAFIAKYVKRMKTFSDDGKTLHGAYGHRWYQHFMLPVDVTEPGGPRRSKMAPIDQITTIVNMLKANHDERRAVVGMWDPTCDLGRQGKDVPCNTHIYFSVSSEGRLDMTVCCRSNDIIWGAYGANAVHFSMLQEYVAAGVGVEAGDYWQISNNYHAYRKTFDPLEHLADEAPDPMRTGNYNPYAGAGIAEHTAPYRMVSTPIAEWRQDLEMYLDEGVVAGLRDSFFRKVVVPVDMAHRAYRENEGRARYEKAMKILQRCDASDWRTACEQWLLRRLHKFERGEGN